MVVGQKMIGLFKTAKGKDLMELRETDIPRPGKDEVLLEIKACGICGTDIHIKHDTYPYWPPVIMGHEFSGEVVEVGEDVGLFTVGDRVVGEPHTKACGKCELCRTGNIQICSEKRSPGWGINGGFAKYLAYPEHLLHKIPDDLSFVHAALVEPAANVVQDVLERGRVDPNDTVVVLGAGPIGLLSVMCAKAAGAGKVFLVGVSSDEKMRFPVAREIGVDGIYYVDKVDAVNEINKVTDGRGADLVVEASGAPTAIYSTVGLVRRLGRIVQIGLTGKKDLSFPWDDAAWKGCHIMFNLSTAYSCWDRTIGMISSGRIDADKIITQVRPLSEWETAFDDLENMRSLKTVLIP
jgi:L-iditol 2-dehydrogenase